MRYLTLSFLFTFLLGYINTEAQYLYQPDQRTINSLTVSPLKSSLLSDIGSLTEIPTIDFPEEAKILVWWPDSNIDYKMPNALSPEGNVNGTEILQGNKANGNASANESKQ
jgi:hypothetical protein